MSMLVEQEKSKYDRMWDYPGYKFWNGPDRVTKFMNKCFTGKHSVLEFGCGTGMNSLTMHNQGHDVWMMDITDHSLLPEAKDALGHRFFVSPIHLIPDAIPHCEFGFCGDVMEHVPTVWVSSSFAAIKKKVDCCYFLICGVGDTYGKYINETLHLTVQSKDWWIEEMLKHWKTVEDCGSEKSTYALIGRK